MCLIDCTSCVALAIAVNKRVFCFRTQAFVQSLSRCLGPLVLPVIAFFGLPTGAKSLLMLFKEVIVGLVISPADIGTDFSAGLRHNA